MKFTIWGEIGAEGSNGSVVLSGRLRLLLGGLLAGRNAEVGRDDLITVVWGEESEPLNAEASLRQYVSRLRKALAKAEDDADRQVRTTPSGYRLDIDRSSVDADRLEDAVAAGVQPEGLGAMTAGEPYGAYCEEWWCLSDVDRQRDLAARAATLPLSTTTATVPSGTVTFLFTDMEASAEQWETVREEMAQALERHDAIIRSAIEGHGGHVFSTAGDSFAAAFSGAGQAVEAAIDAQRELREARWPSPVTMGVRMGLHTGEAQERDGDYFGPAVNRAARLMATAHGGQVLASSTVGALVEDYELLSLGEHWLKDLSAPDRVFQVLAEGLESEFAPIRSLDVIPNNLPILGETLIGRDYDHERVTALLSEHDLVTVTGVGGVGKTRLVTEVAAGQIDEFPDGVWWCELASVADVDAVAHTISRVLGVRQRPGASMSESIAEYCRQRRLLLVLDNCEHVVDATASLVEQIRATGSSTKVLASSREALGCAAEQIYPLGSLSVDGEHPDARELFLRRARALLPDQDWSEADLAGIDRVCRRLDGIPLAIELAAARSRSLSVADLEQRLDRVFQVLRGGRRRVERHRTLQAAIDWSHQALDPGQALCFDRLSVFAGGWTLDAAEAITADDTRIHEQDVIDILDDLVAKSLVTMDHTPPSEVRYRLLEPLRQYGEDQLAARGEADQTHNAHTAYYTQWAETWDDNSWADEVTWRIAIETELANLRAAANWAISRADTDHALRIVTALNRAILPFVLHEISDWGAEATELPAAGEHPLGPVVAGRTVATLFERNDLEAMPKLIQRAEAMATYDPTAAQPSLGRVVVHEAVDHDNQAAIEVLNRVKPKTTYDHLVRAWMRTAWIPTGPQVPSDLETMENITRETDSIIARILYNQARTWAALAQGHLVASATYAREAIANAQRVNARHHLRMSLATLGLTAGTTGGLTTEEIKLIAAGLVDQRDAGQVANQWFVVVSAAAVFWHNDRQSLAAQIHRGFAASPWSGIPTANWMRELLTGIDTYLDDTEPAWPLDDLVDRVLAEIPEIVHELETKTPQQQHRPNPAQPPGTTNPTP